MKCYKYLTTGFFVFVACTFLWLSCSNEQNPADKSVPIEREKHVALLTKIITISNTSQSDSAKAAMISHLLDSSSVSIEQLQNARLHFREDSEYWLSVYKEVQDRLKNKNSKQKQDDKAAAD